MQRFAIREFSLANPLYKGATVTFYKVVNGAKTSIKATLYAEPIGSKTLPNPQRLSSDGKFVQPVYVEEPVIGSVSGLVVPGHDTPIIATGAPELRVQAGTSRLQYSYDSGASWNDTDIFIFRDRGTWAQATDYRRLDLVTHGGLRYLSLNDHTSSASFSNDLAVPHWVLVNTGITAFGMSLIDDPDAAAGRVTLDVPSNANLIAVATHHSGATEPSPTYAHQFWADTASGKLKMRNGSNTAWIPLFTLSLGPLDRAGGTMEGLFVQAAGANIASAATIDLTAATGNSPRITGTTATSAVIMNIGQWCLVVADAAWPLIYHPTNNRLNTGGANVTLAPGDRVLYHRDLSGVIHGSIIKADGSAVVGSAGFTTGDVKITLKTVADPGWVLMDDGTIGNAASGATTRANADTEALFTLLWNNTSDAQCPVSGGRGASAAADFAANKTIALPKALGRALATYGAGAGLTPRVLAQITGVETHALSIAELPIHSHANTATTTATVNGTALLVNEASKGGTHYVQRTDAPVGTVSMNNANTGSGAAHQNMQPTLFLNTMIKL
jgi:hypothetical protein